jgi:hypothetical protein
VGYQRGRADGYEHAIGRSSHRTTIPPPPRAQETYRNYAYPYTREQEERDLRTATSESRRTSDYESRGPSSSGAGPSHSYVPSRRPSPGPSRRRPSSPRPPPPPKKEATNPTEPGTREVKVTCRDKFLHWPDKSSLKHESAACLPVPLIMTGAPIGMTQTYRVPHPAPSPESASSYLELWAGFIMGRSIPDVFPRLFEAYGTKTDAQYVRSAMVGYGLSRRITVACPDLSRNTITAFLIVLATADQFRPFLPDFWPSVLKGTEGRPADNWAAVRGYRLHLPGMEPATHTGFQAPPTVQQGQTVPIVCTTEAWRIITSWSHDDFLRFLVTVRPTVASLRALLDFADAFIRTRQAGLPVLGHPPVGGFDRNQMFMSPFRSATPAPFTFTEGPTRPTDEKMEDEDAIDYGEEEKEAAMDVDSRNTPGPQAGPSK